MNRKLIILFIYLLAFALVAAGCSTGPVKPCKDDPEQFRCQPREPRGGRHVKFKFSPKFRQIICTDRLADPNLVRLAKCRKAFILAGL